MMEYPRFVYKNNGPLDRAGGSYDSTLVDDESEYIAALKGGWFDNLQDAIDSPKTEIEPVVKESESSDDATPTREELEAKANELGIRFDGRIGDKKLSALIAKYMEV